MQNDLYNHLSNCKHFDEIHQNHQTLQILVYLVKNIYNFNILGIQI